MSKRSAIPWGKWLSGILLVGAAVGAGYWYWQRDRVEAAEYQTDVVARGDITQAVTATGQLNPVVNVQVGSQISGIIKRLYADYNSVVKSNQVIAEIDPSTYKVNVQRAEAQVANSRANLALAEVQARRAQTLFTDKLISAAEHDTAMAQLQQSQAQVQSDEAALQNAKVQLSYCTIYAPVDGVVITRNVDVGQTVAASFNTPTLFLIANDLTKMQIDALVSEADIGGVLVGQDVQFTVDAHPYRTFHGKVNQIRYGAITNANVINYDCVIAVANPDLKLLPGMTANVSIITAVRENALKIPNAALRYRPAEALGAAGKAGSPPRGMGPAGAVGGGAGSGMRPGGPGGGMRGEMAGAGGAGAGMRRGGVGDGGGSGAKPRGERQFTRTVYVLPAAGNSKKPEEIKPQPVEIKVGVSDGIVTEVLDGLEEGQRVVTAAITRGDSAGGQRPGGPGNPFGGGFRRF
jgi:HlyD family secretion protein